MQAEYLSIGKVAKQKNISIKALRYYDEIGIFVPAYINPKTNYRYYTKEQLPMLDAVNLCLKLGIPLKTLPTYINNGIFDFSALLSDTRKLAEEKIQGIQLALDKIQGGCETIISDATVISSTTPAISVTPAPATEDFHAAPLTITFAEDEYLVALPLSVEQLPPYDGFVLKLFIFARQRNLILENPSCILYRYENSNWQKYLCLKLSVNSNITADTIASVLAGTEFSLFKIPAGTFNKHLRANSIDSPSSQSISVWGKTPEGYAMSLLERMLTDGSEYNFELIDLHSIKCS